MNYFKNCQSVAEAKKLYKELAMKHHPDLGGDTATMQEINYQYELTLKRLDGQKTVDSDGVEHTYTYNEKTESQIMETINQLLSLQMINVDIFLVGTWIWIDGETKPYKDSLKKLSCRWHSVRKCWYCAFTPSRYRKNSSKGIEDIAVAYGAVKIAKKAKTSRRKVLA